MRDKMLIGAMVAFFAMAVITDFSSALLSRLSDIFWIGGGGFIVWRLRQGWSAELAELRASNQVLQRQVDLLRAGPVPVKVRTPAEHAAAHQVRARTL